MNYGVAITDCQSMCSGNWGVMPKLLLNKKGVDTWRKKETKNTLEDPLSYSVQ